MIYQLFFETEGSRQYYGEYRSIEDALYFFESLMKHGSTLYKASDITKIEVICLAKEPKK